MRRLPTRTGFAGEAAELLARSRVSVEWDDGESHALFRSSSLIAQLPLAIVVGQYRVDGPISRTMATIRRLAE